jgi:hypothetical protein
VSRSANVTTSVAARVSSSCATGPSVTPGADHPLEGGSARRGPGTTSQTKEDKLPAADSEGILKRAELARRELRALAGDDLSAQARQRVGWVIHDLDVIVAAVLQEIIDDVDSPSTYVRRQRELLG